MPNQPRANNGHKSIRVEDELWEEARVASVLLATTRAEIARKAFRKAVAKAEAQVGRSMADVGAAAQTSPEPADT
jgi:hypothetical protein